jgi:hypothetical protein
VSAPRGVGYSFVRCETSSTESFLGQAVDADAAAMACS